MRADAYAPRLILPYSHRLSGDPNETSRTLARPRQRAGVRCGNCYDAYAMKWGYMAWAPAPPTGSTLDAINGSITKGYPLQK